MKTKLLAGVIATCFAAPVMAQSSVVIYGIAKTKQFSIGYEYSLSKRTYLYFDASNKKSGVTATSTTSIKHYAVGVNHAF